MTTMQKVAWPITIVVSEKLTLLKAKNEFSAMPVMIPGSASGRISISDTASRPKKRKRGTGKGASEPSTSAMLVEMNPARTDSHSASRISELWKVDENHFVESPCSGQLWMFDVLNA